MEHRENRREMACLKLIFLSQCANELAVGEKRKNRHFTGFNHPPPGPFTPQLSVSKMVIFVKNRLTL